ncbi:hypothetical protein VTH06DRAFT_2546 [Thermothelomyces fergusii]
MAQPPEAAPLRLQSSLDSAPVQPRVQPNLDALVGQSSPRSQHQHQAQSLREHDQQQSRQPQFQLQHQSYQPLALSGAQPHGAPQSGDAPVTSSSAVHSTSVRCSPGSTGGERAGVEGVSPAVNANPNRLSVAHPSDTVLGTRGETQHKGGAPGLTPSPSDMSKHATGARARPAAGDICEPGPLSTNRHIACFSIHVLNAVNPVRPLPTKSNHSPEHADARC